MSDEGGTEGAGEALHHLRAGGVSLVLDATGPGLPTVLHWGADLGGLGPGELATLRRAAVPAVVHSALDEPWPLTVLPAEGDGWLGRPGLAAARDGVAVHPRWGGVRVESQAAGPAAGDGAVTNTSTVTITASDQAAGIALRCELLLDGAGVLTVRHRVTSTGSGVLDVLGLLALLPLPAEATETLDLTGRWCRERSPQRAPLRHGGRARESRRGRTGHDAPLLLVAGTAGFGFATGEVRAVHVAWSGDHVHLVERLPEGAGHDAGALGGGELLRPGEVRLARDQSYTAPDILFAWSDGGLDGLSARWHDHVRSRPGHPRRPRPLTLNTWEAVYLDHDLERLTALAEVAASVGVERVVLDDGWFRGRRGETAGLGDWEVDPDVWPEGLHPFTDRVRQLGMEVGLWVEPEMVNPDSDLVRAHPDWLLSPAGGTRPWRHQQLLDLTRPEAFEHVLARLDALVSEYRPGYLKWDHNRDLHEAVTAAAGGDPHHPALPRPAVHDQTRAVYRLLDELRARHPDLEVESCASGGARVDLGILARTQRVWASDCNDPVERQAIQRWTGLLLPPELVGSHVGPAVAHTTGRASPLAFRALTALFGHAGLEWDLTACSEAELEQLRHWAAHYRRLRPLLHGGRTVRLDERDGAWLHGVVAPDASAAVYAHVRLSSGADALPGRLRLPGLDPSRRYRVAVTDVLGPEGSAAAASHAARRLPAWFADGVEASGAVLGRAGVALSPLDPGSGTLVEVGALDGRAAARAALP